MEAGPMRLKARRLSLSEMDDAALVHRAAFDERLPWLSGRHTPTEDREFFRCHVFETCEVWGRFDASHLLGFVAFHEGWIDQLYVLPRCQGRGIGSELLDTVEQHGPWWRLWTFRRNEAARRFYENRGFSAIRQTDGSANDEREPDVLYEWRRPPIV